MMAQRATKQKQQAQSPEHTEYPDIRPPHGRIAQIRWPAVLGCLPEMMAVQVNALQKDRV
jgi:hypothetical protein